MLIADLLKEVKYGNSKKGIKYAEEISSDVQSFIDMSTKLIDTSAELKADCHSELNEVLSNLTEKFNSRLQEKSKGINYLDFKHTPIIEGIQYSRYGQTFKQFDKSDKILTSFRVDNKDVLSVAETLGLVIIPHQYVNDEMVKKDTVYVDEGIGTCRVHSAYKNFINESEKQNLNVWLICPIQYYDIERHARDLSFESFIPRAISQAFTSIKIILPMLVGMIEQIESLKNQVDNINVQLDHMKSTLKAQQQQIERLENELVIERQRRAAETQRINELEAQVKRQAEIQWSVFDPLQIAVPDHVKDINTYEGNVALGVAWGPEIDDALIQLLGLTRKETRSNFVSKQFRKFY